MLLSAKQDLLIWDCDLMHVNVHKTLSTPHGGGGPGAGPVTVVKKLEKYLPVSVC